MDKFSRYLKIVRWAERRYTASACEVVNAVWTLQPSRKIIAYPAALCLGKGANCEKPSPHTYIERLAWNKLLAAR